MDREVERLLNQCAELTADPEIASEDAEKPLVEAVELLKLTESVAGFPEALAPENWLLCAEAALGVGNVKLAHSSLESFMIVQPCRDQFLARAYFAMGRVQSAYCAGLKAQELLDYTMMALNHVQHGLKVAAELGVAHRFLVYNGSVHLWNVARPLMATPSHAASRWSQVGQFESGWSRSCARSRVSRMACASSDAPVPVVPEVALTIRTRRPSAWTDAIVRSKSSRFIDPSGFAATRRTLLSRW